jgi:hypothetical protein
LSEDRFPSESPSQTGHVPTVSESSLTASDEFRPPLVSDNSGITSDNVDSIPTGLYQSIVGDVDSVTSTNENPSLTAVNPNESDDSVHQSTIPEVFFRPSSETLHPTFTVSPFATETPTRIPTLSVILASSRPYASTDLPEARSSTEQAVATEAVQSTQLRSETESSVTDEMPVGSVMHAPTTELPPQSTRVPQATQFPERTEPQPTDTIHIAVTELSEAHTALVTTEEVIITTEEVGGTTEEVDGTTERVQDSRANESPDVETKQYIDTLASVTEIEPIKVSNSPSENATIAIELTDAEPGGASPGTISMTLIIIIAVLAVVVVVIVVGLIIYFVRRKRDRKKIEDGETRPPPNGIMQNQELQYEESDNCPALPENELPPRGKGRDSRVPAVAATGKEAMAKGHQIRNEPAPVDEMAPDFDEEAMNGETGLEPATEEEVAVNVPEHNAPVTDETAPVDQTTPVAGEKELNGGTGVESSGRDVTKTGEKHRHKPKTQNKATNQKTGRSGKKNRHDKVEVEPGLRKRKGSIIIIIIDAESTRISHSQSRRLPHSP